MALLMVAIRCHSTGTSPGNTSAELVRLDTLSLTARETCAPDSRERLFARKCHSTRYGTTPEQPRSKRLTFAARLLYVFLQNYEHNRSYPHATTAESASAANVGTDKDSETRQRAAIEAFAKHYGAAIVDWFYDPAVSGADPIEARPGFSALLDRLESNGVRTVVVEDASRFARDLVAQELGVLLLIKRGVRVLTGNGDDLTDTSDPPGS
jgi:hypothetical protein